MDASIITLRVTASGPDVARVSVRRQQFVAGRPLEFDETTVRIAAIEYALGAVGAEIVNGFRAFASRRNLELDAIEAVVTGELEHALMYLEVIGEHGQPAITRLHVKLFVATADQIAARALLDDLLPRLPLVGTLRVATRLSVDLNFTA